MAPCFAVRLLSVHRRGCPCVYRPGFVSYLQRTSRRRFVTFLSTPLSTASPETCRRASFSLEMEFQGQRVSPSYGTNVNFAGNCQSAPSPPARRAEPNERGGRRQGVGEPSPTPQGRPLTTSAWQEQAPEPGRLCGEPGLSGQGQGPRGPAGVCTGAARVNAAGVRPHLLGSSSSPPLRLGDPRGVSTCHMPGEPHLRAA